MVCNFIQQRTSKTESHDLDRKPHRLCVCMCTRAIPPPSPWQQEPSHTQRWYSARNYKTKDSRPHGAVRIPLRIPPNACGGVRKGREEWEQCGDVEAIWLPTCSLLNAPALLAWGSIQAAAISTDPSTVCVWPRGQSSHTSLESVAQDSTTLLAKRNTRVTQRHEHRSVKQLYTQAPHTHEWERETAHFSIVHII